MEVLVDSNVLLDVLTRDARWYAWSAAQLVRLAERTSLVIDPVVYAEVAVGFARIEELEAALPAELRRDALPYEAAFLAGQCFLRYRRAGGQRRSPLPDFYIGAHAAVRGMTLLTRDARRYRRYFPRLAVVSPSNGQ